MNIESGDYNVKSLPERGLDILFCSDRLSDTALSAVLIAERRFDPRFPGWKVYRTIMTGTELFHCDIEAYAILMARALARSHRTSGHRLVRKPGQWIAQAGRDGAYRAIYGRFPESAVMRGTEFDISDKTYSRLRNTVAGGMLQGFENFRGVLWSSLYEVFRLDSGFSPSEQRRVR